MVNTMVKNIPQLRVCNPGGKTLFFKKLIGSAGSASADTHTHTHSPASVLLAFALMGRARTAADGCSFTPVQPRQHI